MARSEHDFPATPLRRRLLVAALAVATAVTLILMMLERVGAPALPRPPAPPGPAPCAEGQLTGCVGGKAEIFLVPTAPPSAGASAGR